MIGRRTTGWLGFDIGGASVKAAIAVRAGREYRIRAGSIVPRRARWNPQELAADQPLSSADELQASAALCDSRRGGPAAAVMPMVLCDTLQVGAPGDRRSGIDVVAQAEAELHQSLEGFVVRSWPAGLLADKHNVITIPAAWSEQASADVSAGRWNCRAIDALPWALARAVGMAEPDAPARTVAALDWGYGRATLCLVHEGAPAIVRCLKDCGFQDAIAALQRGLRLSETDAESVLLKHGRAESCELNGAGAVIAEALNGPLSHLVRELRRTLGFWQSISRGVKAERLYLFGGGASIAGLAERLNQALELDVQLWRLEPAPDVDAELLPPAHLLGPALAASALAWENSWLPA